jgi:hypothetical protein
MSGFLCKFFGAEIFMRKVKSACCGLFVVISVLTLYFVNLPKSYAGTLACAVRTSACNSGEVIVFKMSGTTNAHAELPASSNYTKFVCCGGISGIKNTCDGTYAVVAKLSGTTNAHIEQNSQANYANSACLKAPVGGSVTIVYQDANCDGYNTTIATMSGTTNAHVAESEYTTKICGTMTEGSGLLSVDIVDSGDISVINPSVTMTSKTVSFTYLTSTGIFGATNQRVRVQNTTGNPLWLLTVAASGGNTSLWSAGTPKYDYNDPTANAADGGDLDLFGGQLTLNPAAATSTPGPGCSNTGISLGSSNAFSEVALDDITLFSAGVGADTGCYWDLTSVGVSQTIPVQRTVGTYTLDMLLTVTAV